MQKLDGNYSLLAVFLVGAILVEATESDIILCVFFLVSSLCNPSNCQCPGPGLYMWIWLNIQKYEPTFWPCICPVLFAVALFRWPGLSRS